MKETSKVLETAVINAFEKITKSRGYAIAKMKYEEVEKAIADNEDWDYLHELMNEVVDAMYELLKMKEYIKFIHENNYED